MATLRGAYRCFNRNVSQPNVKDGPYQLLFYRGIASKLFVKGLSFSTTEEALAEAFSKFGNVLKAKVIRDKVKQRSKGFGYVTFAEEEAARDALIDMNGKLLDGRIIFVDTVRPSSQARKPAERSLPDERDDC